jgi:hypothetical protein
VGVTTVNCSAVDLVANRGECDFTVTIEDREKPVVICPSNGENTATSANFGYSFTVSSSDNVNVALSFVEYVNKDQNLSGPVATIDQFGTALFRYTVIDDAGNVGQCQWTFLLRDSASLADTVDPIISGCPTSILEGTTDADKSTGPMTWNIQATDNVGIAQTAYSPFSAQPGAQFQVGDTSVVYTVEDANGNAASCSFVVRIRDDDAPTMACPNSVTVSTSPGEATRRVSFATPIAIDNVALAGSPSCTRLSNARFPLGATEVVCSATDTSGNKKTCQFTITVEDREDPVIACPQSVQKELASGSETINVNWPSAIASDNDGIAQLQSSPSPGQFTQGTHLITFTATDHSGNRAACTMLLTITAPAPVAGSDASASDSGASSSAAIGGAVAGLVLLVVLLIIVFVRRRSDGHPKQYRCVFSRHIA